MFPCLKYPEELKDRLRYINNGKANEVDKKTIIKEEANIRAVQEANFEARIADIKSNDFKHALKLFKLQEKNEEMETIWKRYQRITPTKFRPIIRNKRKIIEIVEERERHEVERYIKSKDSGYE